MFSCPRYVITFTYGIYESYMFVLFGIRIFYIFKYVRSMPLISLKLQHVAIMKDRVLAQLDGRLIINLQNNGAGLLSLEFY